LGALPELGASIDGHEFVSRTAQFAGDLICRLGATVHARRLENFKLGVAAVLAQPLSHLPLLKRLQISLTEQKHSSTLQALMPFAPPIGQALTVC
jgi:hypothetical protein